MGERPVRLRAIGRAVPARAWTQADLHARSPWPANPLIDRLFLDSPIRTRGFFVPPDFFLGGAPPSLEDTNRAWREGALLLGGQAVDDALAAAAVEPGSIDFFGVTTVTGYATPGLDLLLARDKGMRPDLQRVHFNNVGCHAAVPLLRTAVDHAARRPGTVAVALATEICSACFAADPSPQNLVALSLFADGAAAAVVSTEGDGWEVVDFATGHDFAHQDWLGFDLRAEGFRIVLHPDVPARVGLAVRGVVEPLLARHGLRVEDVGAWALHPGGARILDAAQSALGLSDAALLPSRRVLRDHGNMSSPSVLFVLAEALAATDAAHAVMVAFGPGLGIEACLLRR
jgi:predicted naringenin-chalcone synthase